MKNFKLLYLLAIVCLAFVSCSKDDDETTPEEQSGKKIKALSMVNGENKDSLTFTYDSEGLLIETKWYGNAWSTTLEAEYSTEYTYSNGKIIQGISYKWTNNVKRLDDKDSVEYTNATTQKYYEFNLVDGKFVKSSYITTVKLNASGLPVKFDYQDGDSTVLTYLNNNIVTEKEYSSGAVERTINYSFDSKKNPLKGSPSHFGEFEYYNANNISKVVFSGSNEANYTYEYDNDGYPVKYTYNSTYKPSETQIVKIYYK